jgi:hypothetical protein
LVLSKPVDVAHVDPDFVAVFVGSFYQEFLMAIQRFEAFNEFFRHDLILVVLSPFDAAQQCPSQPDDDWQHNGGDPHVRHDPTGDVSGVCRNFSAWIKWNVLGNLKQAVAIWTLRCIRRYWTSALRAFVFLLLFFSLHFFIRDALASSEAA